MSGEVSLYQTKLEAVRAGGNFCNVSFTDSYSPTEYQEMARGILVTFDEYNKITDFNTRAIADYHLAQKIQAAFQEAGYSAPKSFAWFPKISRGLYCTAGAYHPLPRKINLADATVFKTNYITREQVLAIITAAQSTPCNCNPMATIALAGVRPYGFTPGTPITVTLPPTITAGVPAAFSIELPRVKDIPNLSQVTVDFGDGVAAPASVTGESQLSGMVTFPAARTLANQEVKVTGSINGQPAQELGKGTVTGITIAPAQAGVSVPAAAVPTVAPAPAPAAPVAPKPAAPSTAAPTPSTGTQRPAAPAAAAKSAAATTATEISSSFTVAGPKNVPAGKPITLRLTPTNQNAFAELAKAKKLKVTINGTEKTVASNLSVSWLIPAETEAGELKINVVLEAIETDKYILNSESAEITVEVAAKAEEAAPAAAPRVRSGGAGSGGICSGVEAAKVSGCQSECGSMGNETERNECIEAYKQGLK